MKTLKSLRYAEMLKKQPVWLNNFIN